MYPDRRSLISGVASLVSLKSTSSGVMRYRRLHMSPFGGAQISEQELWSIIPGSIYSLEEFCNVHLNIERRLSHPGKSRGL